MASDGFSLHSFQELIDAGVLEIGDGYRAKNEELGGAGPIFLRAGHVTDTHIDFAGVERFHAELETKLQIKMSRPGDTVITTKGNSTGRTTFVTKRMPPFVYSPHLSYWRTRNPKRLANGFLRYWSRGAEFTLQLSAMKGSTDMAPYMSLTDQRRLKITLPPPDEQDAIANILGVLDDKIELNRRMNETLEGLARAIFQSWFVDFDPVRAQRDGLPLPALSPTTAALFPDSFEDSDLGKIPKGWETAVLDDVTGFLIGGDWGKESNVEDATEAVLCIRGADIPSLQSGGVGKMPTRYLTAQSLAKRRLREGDIVFEISGGSPTQSTGRPVLATAAFLERLPLPLTCSNFCRLIRPADGTSPKFLYGLLRRLYAADEFLQYENGTTGIKNLAFTVFSSIHRFVRPSNKVMAAFEVVVSPIYAKMAQVGFECEKLAAIRDALLPKLLSGEIRIGKGEERRVKT